MSIFSRLAKNLKRGLRRIAPIAAPILATALPGVGGLIAGAAGSLITGREAARTPPIAPARVMPGAGVIGTIPVRRATPGVGVAMQRRRVERGRIGPVGTVQFPGGRTIQTAGVGVGGVGQMSLLSRLPSIAGRVGQVLRRPGVQTGIGVGLGAALTIDPLTGEVKKKRRRMNFGNAKAARRAIRRIKGARKLLQDIERQLPRRTVRSRSRTPAGHTTTLEHR